jgi:hypothetical protein
MSGPETQLQRRIQRALKDKWPNSYMFKIHGGPYQHVGLPDLIGCIQGRFVALEIKHPDQYHPLSRAQQVIIGRLIGAGGIVAVVETVAQAIEAVEVGLHH